MTKQYIEIIQAHIDGKNIEFRELSASKDWRPAHSPTWNFQDMEYRVAASEPKIPDSIDWEHVAPEFNFMARDEDDCTYIFTREPYPSGEVWSGATERRVDDLLASYRRGNLDWQDSLVARPQP